MGNHSIYGIRLKSDSLRCSSKPFNKSNWPRLIELQLFATCGMVTEVSGCWFPGYESSSCFLLQRRVTIKSRHKVIVVMRVKQCLLPANFLVILRDRRLAIQGGLVVFQKLCLRRKHIGPIISRNKRERARLQRLIGYNEKPAHTLCVEKP
jgi:hypothetical protein